MNLDELKRSLLTVHQERAAYPKEVVAPLLRDNFTLHSLLRSVVLMNLRLAINGHPVWTEADFGGQLRQRRQQMGISLRGMQAASGLTRMQMLRIEHGDGCQMTTLRQYLGAVPVEFRLDR